MRRVLRGAGWLALVALAAGCRRAEEHPRVAPGTPVVLISIDTLRSDRLPAYGYAGVQTPAIDRLAADGILWEHAYTPAPLTFPAHASLLTGLLPPQHGGRDNAGYRLAADRFPYLPRLLADAGYRTGAAVSSWVLRGTAGFAAGFDFYEDGIAMASRALLSGVQRPGPETLAAAMPWLEASAGEPFFFFFHLYEPHTPHQPPTPFAARYADPYDGEVAAADAVVGELLEALDRLGLYDRALILLLSDHGEGLYDHGDYEHGLLLYREVLQVPLIVKLPASERAGERVSRPVDLVDVLPTVLGLLAIEPPGELDGRSLFDPRPDEAGAGRPLYAETVFPRLHFGWSDLYSLIDYPWHFIDGPDPELYDLAADPGETENLLLTERREASRLKRLLAGFERELAAPAAEDPEALAKLSALGYLGTAAVGTSGPLPDPKSKLAVLEDLKRAFTAYEERRWADAEAGFRRLVAAEPQLVDAWEQLGHALTAQGRLEESLAPFRQAMELSGGAPQIAGALAGVLLQLGRLEEARQHAELAAERHEMSRDTLAQIAIRQGDLAAAETLVARALAGRGTRLGPLITQGELLLAQNRLDEAIELTRRVERDFGDRTDWDEIRGLFYLRGSAFARQGKLDEAAAAYRRESELFPDDLAARGRLALVYAFQGRRLAAREILEELLSTHPTPAAHAEAVRTLRAAGDAAGAARLLREALGRWPQDPVLKSLTTASG